MRWGHAGLLHGGKLVTFGGTAGANFYNDLWSLSPVSGDLPAKPPRSSAAIAPSTAAAAGSAQKTPTPSQPSPAATAAPTPGGVEAPIPIPAKRAAYTTPTTVPSARIAVTPGAPDKVSARDFSGPKSQIVGTIDGLFNDIQKEYLQLDQERAVFKQERLAFAEERKANEDLFAKQQKELAALIEQHKEENGELLKKRQVQYDEKVEFRSFFFSFSSFPKPIWMNMVLTPLLPVAGSSWRKFARRTRL